MPLYASFNLALRIVRRSGDRIELVVAGQAHQLRVERRRASDEADRDGLRVIEQHVGRRASQRLEATGQTLRQDSEPLGTEEAHVLPSAPTQDSAEAQQLAFTGGRLDATDITLIDGEELTRRAHPGR